VLKGIIERHQDAWLVPRGDPFFTLARAIVGQQISVKAAASVWDRVYARIAPFSPVTLANLPADALSGLGLSARKIEYLLDLGTHFAKQPELSEQLFTASDETIIERLTQIRGIGRWTAEMALIFAFMRPDVLPVADLGLMKAISLHYRKGKPVNAQAAQRIATPWRPWRSVATWYLWRSLDPEPVEY
jgi:DNA-3-methyladenine glycosylase II